MKIKSLCVTIITLLVSTTQAYALNAGDLNSATGGTVGFNSATNTTTATTSATPNTVMDVNWNKFNIGVGEHLVNSFSSTGQTIVHRVSGLDLSTIAGTITSTGIGGSTGKVVLINPNGVIFNGATVNVTTLLVSALGTKTLTVNPDNIIVENGFGKDIKIYNSNITALNGMAFATDGNIDVRNSSLLTGDGYSGHIQLITADGVNFQYSTGGTKMRLVLSSDAFHGGAVKSGSTPDSYITKNNTTAPSQITVSKSILQVSNTKKDNGNVNILANSSYAGTTDTIVFGSSTIMTTKGAITVVARNSNSNYGNAILQTGTKITSPSKPVVYGTKSSAPTALPDLPDADTQLKLDAQAAADAAAAQAAADKAAADAAAKAAADKLAAEQAAAAKLAADKEKARLAAQANANSINPEKYIPKVIDSPQSLALGQSPSTTNAHSTPIAGAAAKVRRKQNSKFIGYPDKQNSTKMKYYEILN